MRGLGAIARERLVVEFYGAFRVQRKCELVVPAEAETGARKRIVAEVGGKVALGKVCCVCCELVCYHAFTLVGVFCRDAMPGILKSPINTGALAMLGGLVVVPIVNLFSRKPPKELVDGAFACYEKTTVVQQATALGAETLK